MFPIVDAQWADAASAVTHVQPAAILTDGQGADEKRLEALARQIATRKPYIPLIVVDPARLLPENAIPFALSGGNSDRLAARLRAAHGIARRLSSVMRQTMHGRRTARIEPSVKVATLSPEDSAKSLMVRLCGDADRAAS